MDSKQLLLEIGRGQTWSCRINRDTYYSIHFNSEFWSVQQTFEKKQIDVGEKTATGITETSALCDKICFPLHSEQPQFILYSTSFEKLSISCEGESSHSYRFFRTSVFSYKRNVAKRYLRKAPHLWFFRLSRKKQPHFLKPSTDVFEKYHFAQFSVAIRHKPSDSS